MLLVGWLFGADGAATARNEGGSFGVSPPSSPRRHGERREACEPCVPLVFL